jgi:vanillate O-demethylase ferredoxin subunit
MGERQSFEVRVAGIRDEADKIRSYELVALDGGDLPAFTAGAHIDVHLPNGLVRQYSISSDPDDRRRYVIAVQREPESRGGSACLHEEIEPGDRLAITAPMNNFPLRDKAARVILIAGGIGVTPVLSMVRQLQKAAADWQLHYCARGPELTAFRELLSAPPYDARTTFHYDGGDPAKGLDVVGLLATPRPGDHLYCCGPTGLMAAVRAASAHWPSGAVHFEYFSVDEAVIGEHAPDGAFEVEIASTGEVFEIPADKSILEVLEENGIEVDSACQDGLCGTCITGVLEGEPDHRDMVLDDEEHASNTLMTVCCSRARSKRLKLDL